MKRSGRRGRWMLRFVLGQLFPRLGRRDRPGVRPSGRRGIHDALSVRCPVITGHVEQSLTTDRPDLQHITCHRRQCAGAHIHELGRRPDSHSDSLPIARRRCPFTGPRRHQLFSPAMQIGQRHTCRQRGNMRGALFISHRRPTVQVHAQHRPCRLIDRRSLPRPPSPHVATHVLTRRHGRRSRRRHLDRGGLPHRQTTPNRNSQRRPVLRTCPVLHAKQHRPQIQKRARSVSRHRQRPDQLGDSSIYLDIRRLGRGAAASGRRRSTAGDERPAARGQRGR